MALAVDEVAVAELVEVAVALELVELAPTPVGTEEASRDAHWNWSEQDWAPG